MDLLARLSRSLPLVLLVLGLVLLFLLIFLYLLVRSRRGRQEEEEGMAPAPAPAGAGPEVVPVDFTGRDAALGLNASFARGLRLLKRHVSGAGYRAQIPWFLLLGEEAAQKHQLLAGANLDLPLGAPEAGQGCAWWLFDRGVVLDIAPDYVLDGSGRGSDDGRFQQLLRLLKRHRPERPIDGIVLALSGPDLARPGERPAERTARAERKATILAGKLRQAQTRLGLRLPVYLLITGCERLPGFHDFFAELPERLKDEMFGWSSPYGVETAYKSEWVDEAVTVVRRDLLAAQLEVFAERRQPGQPGQPGTAGSDRGVQPKWTPRTPSSPSRTRSRPLRSRSASTPTASSGRAPTTSRSSPAGSTSAVPTRRPGGASSCAISSSARSSPSTPWRAPRRGPSAARAGRCAFSRWGSPSAL